jgi:hypothetical protein
MELIVLKIKELRDRPAECLSDEQFQDMMLKILGKIEFSQYGYNIKGKSGTDFRYTDFSYTVETSGHYNL